MLLKGLVVTALVASAPIAVVATQDPAPATAPTAPAAAAKSAPDCCAVPSTQGAAAARAEADSLQKARAELLQAQRELQQLRQRLEGALDQLDRQFEPQRDRDCSPSRGRALMSHYQWLRDQGHEQRAGSVLAKVVEQVGDDKNRLRHTAQELMSERETAGRFDDVALALVQRMEANGGLQQHHQFETAALAYFLNGKVGEAVARQQQAIARGDRGDDARLRLRTYEAALAAVAKAQGPANGTKAATGVVPETAPASAGDGRMVASRDE
jgi:tetratricopeptide (TPR) repeat protein